MKTFVPYVQALEDLVGQSMSAASNPLDVALVQSALDGGPRKEIMRISDIDVLREDGVFFSGSDLAGIAAEKLSLSINNPIKCFDPACGAGDLLLACARFLPILPDLSSTLDLWGRYLFGLDIYEPFVRATKLRLALFALMRGAKGLVRKDFIGQSFPGIVVGDALLSSAFYKESDAIILNPPYSLKRMAEDVTWTKGKLSMAAVFIERAVNVSKVGTKIVAILPEVLRAGNRYKKWREVVEQKASINSISSYGQFDSHVDIDVFLLSATVATNHYKSSNHDWWKWQLPELTNETLGDKFDISVGPVVPYRDPYEGHEYPFIHPRVVAAWSEVSRFPETRRYKGKVFCPPFIVVRRTSRPGDQYRAVASIIVGSTPIAVENHLLILQPKDGSLSTCRRLLSILKTTQTNDWLNQRIRCRHLTASSVKSIPWR